MLWRRTKQQEIEEAAGDRTSLGNILVKRGYATPAQITYAIGRQLMAAPPLGKILIEMGAITLEQLDEALYEQRRLRGETTNRDDVTHQLTQQARGMAQVSRELTEIADLSNVLVAKLKAK